MLDRYAEPPRDAATLAARREALLDQLGWLEDEAAALAPLLADLPEWAVAQAPLPTDLSAKQTFAFLTSLDREVYPEWLRLVQAEDTPALNTPEAGTPEADTAGSDGGANDRPLDDLLADLRAARADLRHQFAEVPAGAWSRSATLDGTETDLYGVALAIVQRDADHLKELAYRLHEADLRPPTPTSDLPRPPGA